MPMKEWPASAEKAFSSFARIKSVLKRALAEVRREKKVWIINFVSEKPTVEILEANKNYFLAFKASGWQLLKGYDGFLVEISNEKPWPSNIWADCNTPGTVQISVASHV